MPCLCNGCDGWELFVKEKEGRKGEGGKEREERRGREGGEMGRRVTKKIITYLLSFWNLWEWLA